MWGKNGDSENAVLYKFQVSSAALIAVKVRINLPAKSNLYKVFSYSVKLCYFSTVKYWEIMSFNKIINIESNYLK